jgi:hypothetical protein
MNLPINPSKSLARLNPQLFQGGIHRPASSIKQPESERALHDQIEALARENGWLYVHSRMDCPSTIQVGFPDFALFLPGSKTIFLECKRPGGKPTTAQLAKLAHARKLGFTAEIVTSMEEVLKAIQLTTDEHR